MRLTVDAKTTRTAPKAAHRAKKVPFTFFSFTPEQYASVRQQAVAFQLLTLLEEVIEEPDEIQ